MLRHLREDVGARVWLLVTTIALDSLVHGGFVYSNSVSATWLWAEP